MIVPRTGIARGSVCVQVRYVLWGLIAKEPVHEETFVTSVQVVFVGSLFSSPLRLVEGRMAVCSCAFCTLADFFGRTIRQNAVEKIKR